MAAAAATAVSATSNSHTEKLKLKAGTFVTIPVILDSSSQVIQYSFSIGRGLDAELSCVLYESDEAAPPVQILSPRRIMDVTDSIRVNLQLEKGGHRTLEFKLSNVYSWIRSKRVTYTLAVTSEPSSLSTLPVSQSVPLPSKPEVSAGVRAAMEVVEEAERSVARTLAAAEAASKEQTRVALQLSAAEVDLEKITKVVSALRASLTEATHRSSSAADELQRARAAVTAALAASVEAAAADKVAAANAAALLASPTPAPPPTVIAADLVTEQ